MYNLLISPAVREDLAEIKDYISHELNNPHAADRLIAKIISKIRRLTLHPGMGAPLSSVVSLETDYRFLVCAHYLIFYRLEDGVVYVSAVIYGRRDYIQILFPDLPDDED
jgi:plasmid stabilization system protein ParE